jgi:hypothetical protein
MIWDKETAGVGQYLLLSERKTGREKTAAMGLLKKSTIFDNIVKQMVTEFQSVGS